MSELIDKDEILKKAVTIPGPSGRSVFSVVFTDDVLNAKPIEPTTKNDLGVDAVSRKAVINQIFYSTDNNGDVVLGLALIERIARLPSVTPQEPRKGHWMGSSYDYICSNCEHSLNDLAQSMDYISFSKPKYCPNCGCRMIEPQESEDV